MSRKARRLFCCLILAALLLHCSILRAAFADDATSDASSVRDNSSSIVGRVSSESAAADPVDAITDVILIKIMELQRFYLRYREISTREPRSRHARYFIFQESAAALFLSSQTMYLVDSARSLRNPDLSSASLSRAADIQGVVATILEGGSSGFELGSNALQALKNIRMKNDPESARKEFCRRLGEIDSLIAAREKLLSAQSAPDSSVPDLSLHDSACDAYEGKLLGLLEDLCLYEFADIYADAKSLQASSNVYYALDVLGSSLILAAYCSGMKSSSDSRAAGGSAIESVIGDTVYLPSASASVIAYNKLYKHYYDRLGKETGKKIYDAHQIVDAKLAEFRAQGGTQGVPGVTPSIVSMKKINVRNEIYSLLSKYYGQYIKQREADVRRDEKISKQNEESGPIIAAGFLASDIIGTYATYKLEHRPRNSDTCVFAGLIPTVGVSAASLGLTTAWFISDEINTHKLRKAHALPTQLIEARLAELSALEEKLKDSKN